MRLRSTIIGIGALAMALSAYAQTSVYSSMAVPGSHNVWNTAPSMVLTANNIWVGTQTLSSASGEFKFAANGTWDDSWGGNASIIRVPAMAFAMTPTDTNLRYEGLSNGLYRFTFNDSTREFRMEWASAAPLPRPAFTNLALVGDFNGWAPNANSLLTNHPAPNTDLWSRSMNLELDTAFQFLPNIPNPTYSNQFGAPEATPITITNLNNPVTNSACGKNNYTLSGFQPGTFRFELNVSNNLFAITQTTNLPALSLMAVQGNFIAANNPPANMTRIGTTTKWESEHYITNNGTLTCRFSADNNTRLWGATNGTPAAALPAAGTLPPALTNFVQITDTNVVPGRYRVTFDHQTGNYTFQRLYTLASGVNLIQNPGFENTTDGYAAQWNSYQSYTKTPEDGVPPHSGKQCGALHAKLYENWTAYSSYDQDVSVQTGKTYRASAWIRVTPGWVATLMYLKVEWRNDAHEPLGGDAIVTLTPDTTWKYFSVEGEPPDGATRAHIVIKGDNIGFNGYMCVDDVEMRQMPPRSQTFDSWGQYVDLGPIDAPDGWSATSGQAVFNVSPGRPPAEVLISQYVEGTGNNKAVEIFNGTLSNLDLSAGNYVLKQYNNGSTTASVTMALTGTLPPSTCLVVGRPGTPTNYAPNTAISGTPIFQTNKNLTFNGDDVIVLYRGSTILDRVGQVGTGAVGAVWNLNTRNRTLTRKTTIYTGTTTAVTAPFSIDDWIISANDNFADLGTHSISFTDPNEPYTPAQYSLLLNTNATLMSGELTGGIGDVSFWYRTESASPVINLSIESAASINGPWMTNGSLTGVVETNFRYTVFSVNSPDDRYVRFSQTGGGTNRFRLDEIVVSVYSSTPRLETFAAWTLPSYIYPGNYSRLGWTIENASISTNSGSRAALLDSTNSAVLSPAYADGAGEVVFWAAPAESNSTAYLVLQSTVDGGSNWVTQKSLTVNAASNLSVWLYLTNNPSQIRIGFDPARTSDEVLVDNVEVRIPVLYRNQDFNSWPAKSSYTVGTDSHQGWSINQCMVDAQASVDGNSARLSTTFADAWIRSPYLPDGIGSINFQLNKTTTINPVLAVEVSSNAATWTPIATVTSTISGYTLHSFFYSNTTNHYVRFRHSAGNTITPVDNIRIGTPQARPTVNINVATDPSAISIDDSPYITADVVSFYGASILSVTSVYCIGDDASPTWVPIVMTPVAYGSYSSVAPIPSQPAGAKIRVYAIVRYAGIGAAPGSTGYTTNLATSATLTNYVSSIAPDKVWINEFSYYLTAFDDGFWDQYEDHEFIELCGVAGTSITNWTIELSFGADADVAKNGGTNVYASYPLTHTFSDTTNGFGFYVLGDSGLTNATGDPINLTFTNYVPASVDPDAAIIHNNMQNARGVIRLLDEYKHTICAISYNGTASGASPSGSQSGTSSNSVSLRNTGSTFDDFTWGNAIISIGSINGGQTLVPVGTNELAAVFHIPSKFVDSSVINTNMRSPVQAAHSDALKLYYGFAAAAGYGQPAGTIYYRDDSGTWKTAGMTFREGSQDSSANVYTMGSIPAYTNVRGSTVQYVIEAQISKTGIGPTFIGAGVLTNDAMFSTLDEAKASPFLYTYSVPSIYATSYARATNKWIVVTDGNDPNDPFAHFKVYSSTNLFTPLGLWKTNSFTTTTDYLGQITFFVPLSSNDPINFYRFDPIW
ncbi:MAG: hypothetical protein EOM72_05430 [Opitutae bacterium]|nr:hypothetical protein [Opitutae bacterium]